MRTGLVAVAMLASIPALAGPGVERWSALSRTAMAITGDIALSPARLVAAGRTFPLSVSADAPAFGTPSGPVPARILKVTKPADPRLLHGNTLCGKPVRWLVAYRRDAGRSLTLAAFSGEAFPAGESGPDLCGTFSYFR
ncbi:hypothetical protein DK419_28180 [Methylobacterium terrae]|uniref:Alkaline proteinase inhibitor/ Outer membrane lipoprotein Omp19 domain-containing protein n=1 Tax=Methylobacterium terrae TaxID=2202827 RepID=A0A2U8WWT5_9HYPH|nr:hypothetical protein [Methylobacterium terrae]AWN49732.1 hypothetical protein DK419_28180 [Methylobacterium terrae]